MKVRIEPGIDRQVHQPEKPKGFFKKTPPPTIYEVPCIYVYVELTEQEKAIIEKYDLGDELLEEWKPTAEDERESKHDLEKLLEQIRPIYSDSDELRQALAETRRDFERSKYKTAHIVHDISVRKLVANPYIFRQPMGGGQRHFDDHIEKLKTVIFPKLKQMLESRSVEQPKTQTLEF